ncbi:uncharacterized protein [Halyomorpha halys]|uniref:uncharacterized protein n=1 Tax=Halyomorpha halys TaxID=286706 RepID=UPI0006D51A94|nr:uncharacterized protein LOC106677784 [Halyomorpha halys]
MIPCQLYRAGSLLTWVEVPVHPLHRKEEKHYVVDLFGNSGYLFEKDDEKLKEKFGYQDRNLEPKRPNIITDIEIWLEDIEEKKIDLYKITPNLDKTSSEIFQHRRKKFIKADIRSFLKPILESMLLSRIEFLDNYEEETSDTDETGSHDSELISEEESVENEEECDKRLERVVKSSDVQEIINNILVALFDKGKDVHFELSLVKQLFTEYKGKFKRRKHSIDERKESNEVIYCTDSDIISNVSEWSVDEKLNNEPNLDPQTELVEAKLPREPMSSQILRYVKNERQKNIEKENSKKCIRKKIRTITDHIKRTEAHFFARFNGSHRLFPMDHCIIRRAREKNAWGLITPLDESTDEVDSYCDEAQESLLLEWNKQHLSFVQDEKRLISGLPMRKCTSKVLRRIQPRNEFYSKPIKETQALLLVIVKEVEKHIIEEEKEMASKWTQTFMMREKIYFDDPIVVVSSSTSESSNEEEEKTEGIRDTIQVKKEGFSEKIQQIENQMDVTSFKNKLMSILNIRNKNVEGTEFPEGIVKAQISSEEKIRGTLEIETEELEINEAEYIKKFPGILIVKTGKKHPPYDKAVQTDFDESKPEDIYKKKIPDDILNEQLQERLKHIIEDNISISPSYEIEVKEIDDIPKEMTISELFLLDISSIESSSEENRLIKMNRFAKNTLETYIASTEIPNYIPGKKDEEVKIISKDISEDDDEMSVYSTGPVLRLTKKKGVQPKDQKNTTDNSYTTAISGGSGGTKSYVSQNRKQESGMTNPPPGNKAEEEWIQIRKKLLYDIFYTFDTKIHDLSELFRQMDFYFHENNNISVSQWISEDELELEENEEEEETI